MRLLIMGPPGAGKGTQAAWIAERYGVPAISTGMMFRLNITARTPLGEQVKRIIASGGYVPDELTVKMLFNRLREPDARNGWLVDGFPRTLPQVKDLDEGMRQLGTKLDAVIVLSAEPDALVGRLRNRAAIEGRDDDSEETIRTRIAVYNRETEPLIELYRSRNLVVEVDAMGSVDEVHDRLAAALDARLGG